MSEQELRQKLFWLIGIRLATGTLLLGWAIRVQIAQTVQSAVPAYVLIGLIYALSIVWILSLKFVFRYRWLLDLQLAGDALIVSAFIFITGGVNSYFSSLYVLPIAAASTFQQRRGGLMVAVLSTILYGGLVAAQYLGAYGLLPAWWATPSRDLPAGSFAQFTVAINVFGFFAVAVLSGSLAESLRRAGARLERASNEIADLQAFSQHVIDSLVSGLVTTDLQGHILTFNRAAMAITGLGAPQVIGRRLTDVLGLSSDLTAVVEAELNAEGTYGGYRMEFPYKTPSDRNIEIGLSATALHTPGGRTGWLFTFQDVTEVRKLARDARLRGRLAAVGEMAAGIAHEIRNPLASMSGSIQILRRELPLSAEQAQLMDIVLRESERLNETIRSFLAYARPQRFQIAKLDVRRVLRDAALLLRNSAEVKAGHQIDLEVPESEVLYEADENQIKQIVWNLATNGLRAMPGGGRLCLTARTEPAGSEDLEETVVLEVADQGVGIPADEIDALFQPFQGTFTRGSGLGLAIVHRIVSDYNGDICVKSAPGVGTTVTVRLPVRVAVATA